MRMGFTGNVAVLAVAFLAMAQAGVARESVVASTRDRVVISTREMPGPDLALVAEEWGAQPVAPASLRGEIAGDLRVTYHSGPVARQDGGIALPDPDLPDGLVLADYLQAHPGRAVVALNICGTNMAVSGRDFGGPGDWLVVYPAGGPGCEPRDFARRVLTATEGPPQGWEAAFRQAGLGVARSAPATPSASALQPVANDVIIISTAQSMRNAPRITAQEVAARPADLPAPQTAALVDGMQDRSVQPLRPGLPQPSIIVGEQAIPRPQIQSGPLGVDAAERAGIRRDNPGIYAQMLAEGAFDPDPEQVAAAIQTELARMECYASAIDGVWGRGSVAAVQRYFAKAGGQAATANAELALYRQIIGRDDIRCDPVPVAAPAATPSAPRGGGGGRPSGAAAASRPAATQPAGGGGQPAAVPAPPTISPSFGGSGLFR